MKKYLALLLFLFACADRPLAPNPAAKVHECSMLDVINGVPGCEDKKAQDGASDIAVPQEEEDPVEEEPVEEPEAEEEVPTQPKPEPTPEPDQDCPAGKAIGIAPDEPEEEDCPPPTRPVTPPRDRNPEIDFNMDIRIADDIRSFTTEQLTTILEAKVRWESLVTGDLPEVGSYDRFYGTIGGEYRNFYLKDEGVDDLLLWVTVVDEHKGRDFETVKTIGQSSGWVWGENKIPRVAEIKVDVALLDRINWGMYPQENFELIILHEMGHALGFMPQDYYTTYNGRYFGRKAIDMWRTLKPSNVQFGNRWPFDYVPMAVYEGSHWHENLMKGELMTPYIQTGGNVISSLTLAVLEDAGHKVDYTLADPYKPRWRSWTAKPVAMDSDNLIRLSCGAVLVP